MSTAGGSRLRAKGMLKIAGCPVGRTRRGVSPWHRAVETHDGVYHGVLALLNRLQPPAGTPHILLRANRTLGT